jgi:hypothetical protein
MSHLVRPDRISGPFRHSVFASVLALAAITSLGAVTTADAEDFLSALQGDWRGKGSIEKTGDQPKKDPLACRMSAEYDPEAKQLKLKGRCGSVSATSSFETSLNQNKDGLITGKPILQRGEIAKIQLSGKPEAKDLILSGTSADSDSALSIHFRIDSADAYRSYAEHVASNGNETKTLINWTRQ